jgi:hypothetical protein
MKSPKSSLVTGVFIVGLTAGWIHRIDAAEHC